MVLGLSFDYHDAAAALLVDGDVVAAVEEERLSRRKHDADLPRRAIACCLRIAGLEADDVDVVACHERPLEVLERYLASRRRMGPRGLPSFVRDVPRLVGTNLRAPLRIEAALRGVGRTRALELRYLDHHRSHAAAAFFASPFEHAAVITVDGIGEWATTSIASGSGPRLEVIEELRYPDSVGLLYSLVTRWCGFEPLHDESKVMGLAPYGEPRYLASIEEMARLLEDGSVRVDGPAIGWFTGRAPRHLSRRWGGPPRRPDEPITGREADLAASIQRYTESAVLGLAERAAALTGERHLCLAGGVALNGVANGRVAREGPFAQIWVQPAAGDAGSALGAALEVWHRELGGPRVLDGRDRMADAALGPRFGADELASWVATLGVPVRRVTDRDRLGDEVAERLDEGAVVGWFQGRMEFGPRALGHRSILADPRRMASRQRINRLVKGREDFRPLAPAVLEERATAWFELDGPSPYMLVVAPLRAEHLRQVDVEPAGLAERAEVPRSVVPACTHVDGTARVQTVGPDGPAGLRRLLEAFERRTGCPLLVNTSFNRAGEPIVATPDDAWATARAAGLDLLVVEDWLIEPTGGS